MEDILDPKIDLLSFSEDIVTFELLSLLFDFFAWSSTDSLSFNKFV